jgi:hypothetical protein
LVGTSSSLSDHFGGSGTQLQIAGTSYQESAAQLNAFGTNQFLSPHLVLNKARGTQASPLSVVNNDKLGGIVFTGYAASTPDQLAARIECYVDGDPETAGDTSDLPGRLVFSTTANGSASPTERMRINALGGLKVSNNGTYPSSLARHEIRGTIDNLDALFINHAGTSGTQYGIQIQTANDQNDATRYFLTCYGGATGQRATIRSNGGFANYQANDVNLSDRNAKKDISPASGTWDCLKQWEIINYRYKDQPDDADLNLGVIAQQVAESCPEVITVFKEAEDDQPEKLGVKEQQMYWMAIKALQEAQVRIETLEAEVAALKAQ